VEFLLSFDSHALETCCLPVVKFNSFTLIAVI